MSNRFAAAMLVLAAAAGYAIASPPARAQTEFVPFGPGDRIQLRYEAVALDVWPTVECVVGAVYANWVRCEPTDRFKTQPNENWWSLKSVVRIVKYPK